MKVPFILSFLSFTLDDCKDFKTKATFKELQYKKRKSYFSL